MIEVRPCTPGDAATVSTLLGELGYEITPEAAAERLRRLNETRCDATFIASEDSQALGLIALHRCHMIQYPAAVARITALAVDQRARRSAAYWSTTPCAGQNKGVANLLS